MIQFKRGSTKVNSGGLDKSDTAGSWKDIILLDGQPGYDKTSNRLKIGDGHSKWQDLKWLKSGLEKNQILDSEASAKERIKRDIEDITVFTYGKADPTNNLVGEVYLQQYDGQPEADYIIAQGKGSAGNWYIHKWNSGYVECWCTVTLNSGIAITNPSGSLYKSEIISAINYPFTFIEPPTELLTVVADTAESNIEPIFIATNSLNTVKVSGSYRLCAGKNQAISKTIKINYYVRGYYA